MPKTNEKYHLIAKKSVCIPAMLENHCLPESSYVDFECEPGYFLDPFFGLKIELKKFLYNNCYILN